MEFGVRVGGMPVSGSARTEHHVAAFDRTFVHLS